MGVWRSLRKFGLGYCDLPTMLWNCSVLLRPLLLDIDGRKKKSIPFFNIFFPLTVVCYFYVFVISGLWFVFFREGEPGLTTDQMIVLSLVFSTEMGPVKFFYLFLNRLETKRLVEGYLSCDTIVERGSRLARNLQDSMRVVKKRAMIYWMVVIGNGVVYCLKPLLPTTKAHAINERYPLYGFEHDLESSGLEVQTLIVWMAVFFTVYPAAQVSAFIIVIVGYTESQLLGLSCELREMWKGAEQHCEDVKNNPGTSNVDEKAIKNSFIRENLKNVWNFHVMNTEIIRQTERVFKNALAGQLLLLIISLITELLGGMEQTYIQMPFAFVQVAADCLAGQKLIDAGDVFEKALYDSKWENFDVRNRKTVLLMLRNAQKTLNLSAGGISILNFELLMSIIRSVYSAYTALRSKTGGST